MFVCPVTVASILVYRENNAAGVIELLKRSFDYKRIRAKIWYIPIIFLMPAATALTYGLMRVMGLPLLGPAFPVLAALAMFVAFFVAALCEESLPSRHVDPDGDDPSLAPQAGRILGIRSDRPRGRNIPVRA